MAGIEDILNMIDTQQKQTEENIISAANKKAALIDADGKEKAEKAYSDYIKKGMEQLSRDYENSCSSVDAAMKRHILDSKIKLIDETVEAAVKKLDSLHDNEYFSVIEKLAVKRLSDGEGVRSLSSRDLKRVPADFMQKLSAAAQKKGGSVTLGKEPADIENGFVLTYGLIAENCSFRAIIEAEREGVRDTAARELFGQVS